MTVNFAMHLDAVSNEEPNYALTRHLHEYLPKDWKFHLVFRFTIPALSKREYSHISPFYLYEHFFANLSGDAIREAEKFLGKTFSLVRLMSKVGRYRYPKIGNLPDDKYLANLVLAWKDFFISRKISLFLAGVGDDYSSVIGVEVARRLGVHVIFLTASKFSNSYLLSDKYWNPIFYKKLNEAEIKKFYEEGRKLILGEKITNIGISKFVERDYFNLSSPKILAWLAVSSIRNMKRYYSDIPKCDRRLWYSTYELIVKRIKAFIRSRVSKVVFRHKPSKNDRFVFYPLHFTDDAALTLKAPFVDQFDLIKELAKVLPHGVCLYVKPHPHFQCADIPISKMRELGKIPNVKLIPYDANTKELLSHALYTAVINSSAAFEAVVMGKPAVAFGMEYPPDVIPRIEHPKQLLDMEIQIDQDKAVRYIANCYAHSIFLKVPYYLKGDFSEEDLKAIACAIVNSYNFLCRR